MTRTSFKNYNRREEKEKNFQREEKQRIEAEKIARETTFFNEKKALKAARIKAVKDEEKRLVEEQYRTERNIFVTEKLSNAFGTKTKIDTASIRREAIDNIIPKAFISEQTSYPEPFEEEPALNKELSDFKKKINEHLYKMGFASSGGGGIGDIADAGDMDTATAKVDGKFLRYSSSSAKWIGSDPTDISHAITALDIDGATDIGAAIVDADLFIIDDGANGTNRKVTAARLKTYAASSAYDGDIDDLDIDGGTDIGAAIVDADLFIIDDGAVGTNRKTAASRIKTYIGAPSLTGSTNNTITTVTGASAIQGEANLTFDGTILAVTGAITGTTDLTLGDDLILDSDAAVIQFGDDQEIKLTHLHNQGLEITSTHDAPLVRRGEDVFIVLNGTNSSSTNVGDNIIDETDSDDIIGEDQVFLHTGMQRDVINIIGSDGKIKKSIAGFSAGAI